MPYKDPVKRREHHAIYMRERWYPSNKKAHLARVKKNKRERREWLRALKDGKSCIKCAEPHPACLDFHHRDPKTKLFGLGSEQAWSSRSKAAVLEEIKKCDVMCSNCHRKLHFELRARQVPSESHKLKKPRAIRGSATILGS